MRKKSFSAMALGVLFFGTVFPVGIAYAAGAKRPVTIAQGCNRTYLNSLVNQYLDALGMEFLEGCPL